MRMRRFLEMLSVLAIGAGVIGVVEAFVGTSYPSLTGRLVHYVTLMIYGAVIARMGQRHGEEEAREEKEKEKNSNLWG